MKLNKLRGLAHDLAHHLEFKLAVGEISNKSIENVIDSGDEFAKYCINFFKKRLPEDFDFSRVDKIKVVVNGKSVKRGHESKINVEIIADKGNFKSEAEVRGKTVEF